MKTFYLPTIRLVVLFITILLTVNPAFSQDSTTVSKNRKNGIKINLTNPMFFGSNNYILGYERTVGKHQSFSLNVGTSVSYTHLDVYKRQVPARPRNTRVPWWDSGYRPGLLFRAAVH